jgi:hypothetical protein
VTLEKEGRWGRGTCGCDMPAVALGGGGGVVAEGRNNVGPPACVIAYQVAVGIG